MDEENQEVACSVVAVAVKPAAMMEVVMEEGDWEDLNEEAVCSEEVAESVLALGRSL